MNHLHNITYFSSSLQPVPQPIHPASLLTLLIPSLFTPLYYPCSQSPLSTTPVPSPLLLSTTLALDPSSHLSTSLGPPPLTLSTTPAPPSLLPLSTTPAPPPLIPLSTTLCSASPHHPSHPCPLSTSPGSTTPAHPPLLHL